MSTSLMIVGFIVFWPLGLAMLAYILWGDRMQSAWSRAKPDLEAAFKGSRFSSGFGSSGGRTGNGAFDDYRERELKRLEEERAALERMREEFDAFLRKLRHAKDQEEFDRFMANRNNPAG